MGKAAGAAAQAWDSGDKAAAAKHSEAKKQAKLKMEAANARAAGAILQAQGWQKSRSIDLHGLYVAEAEAATREAIALFKGKGEFEVGGPSSAHTFESPRSPHNVNLF